MEQLKDKMDPRHIEMIEQELRLADTVLRNITSVDDTIQLDHLSNCFRNIDRFLGGIWRDVKPSTRPLPLETTIEGVSKRLEEKKSNMELKYSSVAAAELKGVKLCLDKCGLGEDDRAREHLYSVVNNTDLYISKSLDVDPSGPKKR